jgi:septum formation protein
MLTELLNDYQVILASQSPRRQHLLTELGIPFEILVNHDLEETYPDGLSKDEIPVYLAKLKARAAMPNISDKTLLITADTIVWLEGKVVNKPLDHADAIRILHSLSGNMHEVITGVCLTLPDTQHTFFASTFVYFSDLTDSEISYYIDKWQPLDKAGAYGIQEWIGYIGIERIEGSYFNVMGLPVQRLYKELKSFLSF